MRQVGDIVGRRRADRFLGFLALQGIQAQLRDDGDDHFSVWVIHEDHVQAADEHYRAYRAAPEAPIFDLPAQAERTPPPPAWTPRAQGRSRYVDVRSEIFDRGNHRRLPVTMAFIALSVLLTLLSGIPRLVGFMRSFYFSEYMGSDFPEISHGQVWRLVTPIFLHSGLLHLLFNMMWLYQLGGAIELQEGSVYFVCFSLLAAATVNTAQYLISGPLFVGMSGVVYALFGYVWMMSRHQAGTRYFLGRDTVIIMLGWIVVCLIGLMPGVANTEHVGGLVVGVAWGLLRSGFLRTWIRQQRYRGRK